MDDVERVARYITARKMGLVKDSHGLRLPIDLWTQHEGQARRLLEIHPANEITEYIDNTIYPA